MRKLLPLLLAVFFLTPPSLKSQAAPPSADEQALRGVAGGIRDGDHAPRSLVEFADQVVALHRGQPEAWLPLPDRSSQGEPRPIQRTVIAVPRPRRCCRRRPEVMACALHCAARPIEGACSLERARHGRDEALEAGSNQEL